MERQKTIASGFIIFLLLFYYWYNYHDDSNLLTLKEIYDNNGSLENVNYKYGIPEVVYIVWFGGEISINRLRALNSLIKNIKIPYILITEDNYKSFEKEDHPMHEGFEHLSGNHKSDYLRAYLLNFHGGGYHDIKYRNLSWINQWETFKDKNIWMKSCREKRHSHIGYNVDKPETRKIQDYYKKLGSMCWIISRPKTKYTKSLMSRIDKKLDYHLENLKINPSQKNSGYYADRPFQKLKKKDDYPIRWLELMGEHFHLLMYKYKDHMDLTLPRPNMRNYK